MRKLVFIIAFGVLLAGVSPSHATPPSDVVIHIDTVFPPDGGPASGQFTATGPICSAGSTVDLFVLGGGFQSGVVGELLAVKQFTCADGSGTFLLLLRVHLVFEPTTTTNTFTWSVLSGTGAYENLHGAGTGFGVFAPGGVLDTLTGRMHV